VADGDPVDWALEASSAATQELPLLDQLKLVAEIAAAAHGPEPGDAWGPLRLVSRIGAGAHGDVFRAEEPKLGRDGALKVLRESSAAAGVGAEGWLAARVR